MNLTEQDVRALVREAIERHLGRPAIGDSQLSLVDSNHPSHVLLAVLPGSKVDDGACVIEPSVRCTHCGFCRAYGH